jgi:hypothetical protein
MVLAYFAAQTRESTGIMDSLQPAVEAPVETSEVPVVPAASEVPMVPAEEAAPASEVPQVETQPQDGS